MSNGRLIPRNLDDRKWQDIVDEARALIPKYTPEWTDHNASDLGITLIELFAWITEGLIYRLNRVPEKLFTEFLNLIGITRDPATPARAYLTFTVANSGPVTIPAGTRVATPQTEIAASIVFETDEELQAIPVNLTHSLIPANPAVNPIPYINASKDLITGSLKESELSIPSLGTTMLFLGFNEPTTDTLHLNLRFKQVAPVGAAEIKAMYYDPSAPPPAPWREISPEADETEGLSKNGKIHIQMPAGANWAESAPGDWEGMVTPASPAQEVTDSRFWLAITVGNVTENELRFVLEGIAINSVQATNALSININETEAQAELLGTGNGTAFQTFTLKNSPLYKKPGAIDIYEHLKIQVREPSGGGSLGPWETWSRVEEIPKGDGQYYRCNPVTGDIMFGNNDPSTGDGHGRIPPQNSEIRALNYRHVAGGANGNVSPLILNVLQNPVPGVISVTNPGVGTGGSDQEAIEDTKRRGPEVLRNRFRAVTLEDYEYLTLESTTDVKIVRALPPRLYEQDVPPDIRAGDPWMYANLNRSPGRVNMIIVPIVTEAVARPKPDKELLLEVSEYLNKRRIATALLHVSEPKYLPIDVLVDFRVWQKAIDDGLIVNALEVRDRITERIHKFLHPLWGNIDGNCWEVGRHIFLADLFEFIMPDPEIGFIENLRIKAAIPDYHDPVLSWNPAERPFPINILGVWVQLADFELLCSGTHTVTLKGIE